MQAREVGMPLLFLRPFMACESSLPQLSSKIHRRSSDAFLKTAASELVYIDELYEEPLDRTSSKSCSLFDTGKA
jgi:hypothetical protein